MAYNTKELVTDYHSSGLSRKEYCAKRDIPKSTLDYHINQCHRQEMTINQNETKQRRFLPITVSKKHSGIQSLLLLQGDIEIDAVAHLIKSIQ